jgi:hypothetical protein
MPRGRGRIALTLVRETGRWQRENDPRAFAAYWSALFTPVARKSDAGRWVLASSAPVFVDQPVELIWRGPQPPVSKTGLVTEAGTTAAGAVVPLAPEPGGPGLWRSTFWPRRSGWHRVAMPGGPSLDFFVHGAGEWQALDAARRRAATARFAEEWESVREAALPGVVSAGGNGFIPGGLFALFVAAAGYLWLERRRAATIGG